MSETLGVRIVEYANRNGLDIRDDYSGRGMFGKQCLGVVGSIAELDALLNRVEGSNEGLCKDSMGKEFIYYWPSVTMENTGWKRPDWKRSSKDELASAIQKYSDRAVDIFFVGPDQYWIKDGKFIGKNQNLYCWTNEDGLVCGFDICTVSDRVENIDENTWSFHIGSHEVQLDFN
jgi:hypothetical protein